jgi:hypothetical protein
VPKDNRPLVKRPIQRAQHQLPLGRDAREFDALGRRNGLPPRPLTLTHLAIFARAAEAMSRTADVKSKPAAAFCTRPRFSIGATSCAAGRLATSARLIAHPLARRKRAQLNRDLRSW